jgi:hypothetical protein
MKRQTNFPAEDTGKTKSWKKFLRLTESDRSCELPTDLSTIVLVGRIAILLLYCTLLQSE